MSEQKDTERNADALNQIKNDTGKKYDHSELHINRVPDHSVEKLKELAYNKFAGDYGMALAYLLEINRLRDEFASMTEPAYKKLNDLEEDIEHLKQEIASDDEEKVSKVNTIG